MDIVCCPGYPKRCKLVVDGHVHKTVSQSIVSIRELKTIISHPQFCDRLRELEIKGGIRYAVRRLNRQALHSAQLQKALQRHFLEPDIVTFICEHCQKRGWLNDQWWVEAKIDWWQRQGKSRYEIKARLQQAGITSDVVLGDDRASLERLIMRKYPQVLDTKISQPEQMRVLRALVRRGFSFSLIKDFLQKKDKNLIMTQDQED